MRKPKLVDQFGHSVIRSFGHWPTFILLFFMSQSLNAQSGPVTIHGSIDKPETKIAMYELFYNDIDNNDIDLNEAEIDDQFLIVKNHNAQRIDGKLIIDGEKVFTTNLQELPFNLSVNLLGNGQIWPSEVEYYYDNFENLTTHSEGIAQINQQGNNAVGGGCINFVVDDSFSDDYTTVIAQVQMYLTSVFCCPSSSPVTFFIQPTNEGVASASPLYTGNHVDIQGCLLYTSPSPRD